MQACIGWTTSIRNPNFLVLSLCLILHNGSPVLANTSGTVAMQMEEGEGRRKHFCFNKMDWNLVIGRQIVVEKTGKCSLTLNSHVPELYSWQRRSLCWDNWKSAKTLNPWKSSLACLPPEAAGVFFPLPPLVLFSLHFSWGKGMKMHVDMHKVSYNSPIACSRKMYTISS